MIKIIYRIAIIKDLPSGPSANIKLSKTQFHKIGQSGGLLGRILGLLLKNGLLLMKKCIETIS